jgi:hypothetical protein
MSSKITLVWFSLVLCFGSFLFAKDEDFADPSGIVYDSITYSPIKDARVFIYYVDRCDQDDNKVLVPEEELGPGQQGQRTNQQGQYQFNLKVGRRYKIEVVPPGANYHFPSVLIPPKQGCAKVDQENKVVPYNFPHPKDTSYYLYLDIPNHASLVLNNHIPLDPVSSIIHIEPEVDLLTVSKGEIQTYTITIKNASQKNFTQNEEGELFLQVLLNRPGLIPIPTKAKIFLKQLNGSLKLIRTSSYTYAFPQMFKLGPFPMKAKETIIITYQMKVDMNAKLGKIKKSYLLIDKANISRSKIKSLSVYIKTDPLFTQGIIFGKVFCDTNKDGIQQRNEMGLPNVHVYIDTGSFVITDERGKFHLQNIKPGQRMVKVDQDTLPPESKPEKEGSRILNITPGLVAKTNFAIKCKFDKFRSEDILLYLPKNKAIFRNKTLTILGQADPLKNIKINGEKIKIRDQGRIIHVVSLKPGLNKIAIEFIEKGKKKIIIRKVFLSRAAWFLLAMAQGTIKEAKAKGNLFEIEKKDSLDIGPFRLQGRALLYLKARIQGKYIKQYLVTVHLDTEKKSEIEQRLDQIIDPNKFYPVLGDSSFERKDVESQRQFYVLIDADESTFQVGDFHPDIKGIDLIRYDRHLWGFITRLKLKFKEGYDTKVEAFSGTQKIEATRRAHDVILQNQGSVYYLRHRNIIQASEKVELVIRDRDNNLVIYKKKLERDKDYVIHYETGRIILHGPFGSSIPSDRLLPTSQFSPSLIYGHPVFLEVNYEYEAPQEFAEGARGIYLHQRIKKIIRIGAGYIEEKRGERFPYRLWSVDLKIDIAKNSQINCELAQTRGVVEQANLTLDGGYSYSELESGEGNPKGNALKVEIKTDLGTGKKGHYIYGYFQSIDSGFSASHTILARSQVKFGINSKYRLKKGHYLVLRHDGIITNIPILSEIQDFKESNVQISSLQYKAKLRKGTTFISEFTNIWEREFAPGLKTPLFVTTTETNGGLALRMNQEINEKFNIFVSQSAFLYDKFTSEEKERKPPSRPFASKTVSSCGISFQPLKDLSLNLEERIRWNGDNTTILGIETKIDEDQTLYLKEVLRKESNNLFSTSVIGTRANFGPEKRSRIYSEYEIGGGMSGETGRAIMGVGHDLDITKDINIILGYERTQLRGFYKDKKIIIGSYEVEGRPGFLPYSSKDSVFLGFEYLKSKRFKLTGRYELRYDRTLEKDEDLSSLAFKKFRWGARNALTWAWNSDLTSFIHFGYLETQNLTLDKKEERMLRAGIGLAFRPHAYDLIDVLMHYMKIIDLGPTDLKKTNYKDLLSFILIIDGPFGLQLVERVSYLYTKVRSWFSEIMLSKALHTLLWINRLNYHLSLKLDISGEYRIMLERPHGGISRGTLFEISYLFSKYIRVGIGYNLSSFGDNILYPSWGARGPFFRIQGLY